MHETSSLDVSPVPNPPSRPEMTVDPSRVNRGPWTRCFCLSTPTLIDPEKPIDKRPRVGLERSYCRSPVGLNYVRPRAEGHMDGVSPSGH